MLRQHVLFKEKAEGAELAKAGLSKASQNPCVPLPNDVPECLQLGLISRFKISLLVLLLCSRLLS
jgi:hypothetical protein